MNLDTNTIQSLGIHINEQQVIDLQKFFEETLNQRVGLALIELLEDDEAQELLALQASGASQDAIGDWISSHISDYTEVVEDEYNILLGELAEKADEINIG
jgi:hypothetical protein